MSMINDSDAQALREHLDTHLDGNVSIDLFTKRESLLHGPGNECHTCKETRQLLEEVAALSDKIQLTVHDIEAEKELAESLGIDRTPTTVIGGAEGRARYLGIPAGYEFMSLIEDIVDVSKGSTDLRPKTREALNSLSKDIHIRVFVTPTCPYCPMAARTAHKLAIESERVTADVIEATEFPDLAQAYGVSGVPKVVLGENIEFVGAKPEAQFVKELLRAEAA
jgi:glutaredoxin-like protein